MIITKRKKTISTFMIALIILLPVYSATVFAEFNNVEIYGEDKINGFIWIHFCQNVS